MFEVAYSFVDIACRRNFKVSELTCFMVEGYDAGVGEGFMGSSVRDLEEQNRNLKDRLILVAQNFIDFRDKTEEEMLVIKKDIQILKNSVLKIRDFIETLSGEFGKMAKKEDMDILVKQAKMFQPMNFVLKKNFQKEKKHGSRTVG